MERRRTSPSMIGRDDDLAALSDALEQARDGDAAIVLVGGPAGVGKTRLIREFAAAGDARMLTGGCVDLGEGTLPYAPLVEALRRLRSEIGAEQLRSLAGNEAAELTRLAPGLTSESLAAAHPVDRGMLYESVLAFLARLAAQRPLVLTVEDLHWADRSTLDLLGFLARNLHGQPVLLLASFRTDDLTRTHPLRSWLAEITRLPNAQRLDLAPLDRARLTDLLTAILGEAPDGALVDSVFDRSEGNPFYAEELLSSRWHEAAIPPSLHDVLAARVAEVPDGARTVLRVVAAAGREMDHALLARVAQMPDTDLFDGLREAVASQVLVTDRQGTVYRFRHALLQEVAYSELLPGERVGLHARIAEVLEDHPELAAGGAELAAGELAHHWSAAQDLPKAFTASLVAARTAREHYAFAEALTHIERVLTLWDAVPDDLHEDVPTRHDVLSIASDVASHAAEYRRSVAHATAALHHAEQVQAPAAVIATLLRRLSHLSWWRGDADEGALFLDRALAAAGDEPTIQLAQVLGWQSRFLVLTNRAADAIAPAERAVALARELGAVKEEGYALNSLGTANALLDRLDDALPRLRDARRLAMDAGAVDDIGVAFSNEITLLGMAGRRREAVEVAREARRWTDDAGIRHGIAVWISLAGVEHLTELGDYDDAEALLARTPLPHDDPIARHQHRLASAWLLIGRGDLPTARLHADEAADLVRDRSDLDLRAATATALSLLDHAAGRHAAGLERLTAVLDAAVGWGAVASPHRSVQVYALLAADHARAARDSDDGSTVEATLAGLDAVVARARDEAGAQAHGYTRQALEQAIVQAEAERSWIVGAPDPAAWRDAVAAFPECPPVLEVLMARTRWAEALTACGDREAAAEVVDVALEQAETVGAARVAEELRSLTRRARLPVANAGRDTSPEGVLDRFGLTEREYEVLRLLTDGSTNRQIGEELYISTKTASVHVSNILGKLGVDNRGEAAALAHRAGLSNEPPGGTSRN